MTPAFQSLVQLCLCEPFPELTRAAVTEACRKRTWGTVPPRELAPLVDEVIRRLNTPDLSYLAFKTETGETDFMIYKEWALKRKNVQPVIAH